MLRNLLIYLSRARWARNIVMGWGAARRTARRFVAGETLAEALGVVRELNAAGMNATLDQLGEDVKTEEEAERFTEGIRNILQRIEQNGLRSNVSIKLSQIGIAVDENSCSDNLVSILQFAKERGIFVRIDMEDSSYVDRTLNLYREMRKKRGFDNVGVVIQSYLYRSEKDTNDLLSNGTRIRLVKGAYKEPPEAAFPRKSDVDVCFDRLTKLLLDAAKKFGVATSADGKWPPIPAIGTHDHRRVEYAKKYAEEIGLTKDKVEFQMLYGIRRELQAALAAEGYPVRIYVPFGTHWYPYFMRRLAERPANLWFFLSSLVRR